MNHGEALQKHVGFFEVYEKKNFRFVPIQLKAQRPLYVKNIELDELFKKQKENIFAKKALASEDIAGDKERQIEEKLEAEVEKLIEENDTKYLRDKQAKQPPIIRLRVEYSGFDIIRVKQLESKFMGRVANEGYVCGGIKLEGVN